MLIPSAPITAIPIVVMVLVRQVDASTAKTYSRTTKAPTETRMKRVSRTFMSSRYDCLKSPQWVTLMNRPAPFRGGRPGRAVRAQTSDHRPSYALDLLLSEEAVRFDHQDDD